MTIPPRPQSDVELGWHDGNPAGLSLCALVREDFATYERDLLSAGFWAVFWHRFGNWRMSIRTPMLRWPCSLLYRAMHRFIEWSTGISLNYSVRLGRRVRIWHSGAIQISALAIGDDVQIRQNTTFGVKRTGDPRWLRPTIEDGCDIGAGAVIVGGIIIGAGSVIGANAVVSQDIPPGSIVTLPHPEIRIRQRGEDQPPAP
jgi:serine O-acetyltransferase